MLCIYTTCGIFGCFPAFLSHVRLLISASFRIQNAMILSYSARIRPSKSARIAAHLLPSFFRNCSWAFCQSGNASRIRDRPSFVIATVRLRRQPSLPTRISPSLSSGARFRVNVDRSMPITLASAVIETTSPAPAATKTASCVARSPTDRRASSYKRVTARAAIRVRWHTQLSITARSVTIGSSMTCIYTSHRIGGVKTSFSNDSPPESPFGVRSTFADRQKRSL